MSAVAQFETEAPASKGGGCKPSCCQGKSVSGLLVTVLSTALYIVGAGMLWSTIIENTEDNYHYEGSMNAANYFIVSILLIILPMIAAIRLKAGFVFNFTKYSSTFMASLIYTAFGFGMFFSIGHMEPPAVGRYNYVSFSAPSINALRIAWEEGGRTCIQSDPGFAACQATKHAYNSLGFQRSAELNSLGLSDYYGVVGIKENGNKDKDGEREDVQIALAGVVFILISGYMLYLNYGGKSMELGGYPGVPFASQEGGKWDREFAANTFLGMVSFGLALVAAFVLWTSDAAADPTHPFYETVLGMAISAVLVANTVFLGIIQDEKIFLEVGLFFTGATTIAAPIRMWQLASLSETAVIKDYVIDRAAGDFGARTDVAKEAEVDRYYIGGVLTTLSALIGIYVACKALKTAVAPGTGSFGKASSGFGKLYEAVRYLMAVGSFVLIFVFLGMYVEMIDTFLDAVDASESDRGNAARTFAVLALVAYLGFFINYVVQLENSKVPLEAEEAPAPGAVMSTLALFSPLKWVSFGICTSVFSGFLNIGTHDRQLFAIDLSMAGANEIRAMLAHGADKFEGARAFGVTESEFGQAFGATVILFIAMSAIFTAQLPMPFINTGSSDKASAFSDVKTKTGFIAGFLAFAGLGCFVIGFLSLITLDMAAPPVHKSPATDGVDTTACNSKYFNMHFVGLCDGMADPAADGERYTLNLLNSEDKTDAATARYTEIFTFAALMMITVMASLQGTLGGDIDSVKVAGVLSIFGLLGVSYALTFRHGDDYLRLGNEQNGQPSTADYLCRRNDPSNDDEGECRSFKNGFVFFFLQAFVTAVGAAYSLASQVYDAKPKGEKKGLCGSCCGCCSSGGAAYTEPAAADGAQSEITTV